MDKSITIEEGRNIIAHFMNDGNGSRVWASDGMGGRISYDTSWDWLRPVWDKFREIRFDDSSTRALHTNYVGRLAQHMAFSDISEVCKRLVTAIQWYNSLPTKPHL